MNATYLFPIILVLAAPPAPHTALAEVNACRTAKGLKPYIIDIDLQIAAQKAVLYRAERLIAGHTQNDFKFLPGGIKADCAGCAAWTPDWGWGACETYGSYKYAGAAWAKGRDGRRYMHLFLRR